MAPPVPVEDHQRTALRHPSRPVKRPAKGVRGSLPPLDGGKDPLTPRAKTLDGGRGPPHPAHEMREAIVRPARSAWSPAPPAPPGRPFRAAAAPRGPPLDRRAPMWSNTSKVLIITKDDLPTWGVPRYGLSRSQT